MTDEVDTQGSLCRTPAPLLRAPLRAEAGEGVLALAPRECGIGAGKAEAVTQSRAAGDEDPAARKWSRKVSAITGPE